MHVIWCNSVTRSNCQRACYSDVTIILTMRTSIDVLNILLVWSNEYSAIRRLNYDSYLFGLGYITLCPTVNVYFWAYDKCVLFTAYVFSSQVTFSNKTGQIFNNEEEEILYWMKIYKGMYFNLRIWILLLIVCLSESCTLVYFCLISDTIINNVSVFATKD